MFKKAYPKLVYPKYEMEKVFGLLTKNPLIKAISFVDKVDSEFKPEVYMALYEDIKVNNLTSEPEMLLLQKNIGRLQDAGIFTEDIKKQLHDYSHKIISQIVTEIKNKTYNLSTYVSMELNHALLDDNMLTIVSEIYNGTLETTLQLIEYSDELPHIENKCFLIDALLKQLEKRPVLDSAQAMHLWAYARYVKEEAPIWNEVEASAQELCTDVIKKLSRTKIKFHQTFQKKANNPNKQEIVQFLNSSNWYLTSVVRDFVRFYYNGDENTTQNLLETAAAIKSFKVAGLMLSQLHE